jgi:hypothetical protein
MDENQYPLRQDQRRGAPWIRWLLPLALLSIVLYSPSLMSLLVSLAIIALIWGLIAAASARTRQWTPPPGQQFLPQQPFVPMSLPPEPERPYEEGYTGAVIAPQQTQAAVAEEEERLAQLQLIGDLHHSGVLSEEEFQRQKERILRADASASGETKEASEAEASPERQYEEQPEAEYEQTLPPMEQQ